MYCVLPRRNLASGFGPSLIRAQPSWNRLTSSRIRLPSSLSTRPPTPVNLIGLKRSTATDFTWNRGLSRRSSWRTRIHSLKFRGGTHIFRSRSFLGAHTKRQLWYLYHEFGGSPRVLAAQANKPETYEKRILSEIQRIDPANLLSIFREPELHRSSRYICTVFPSSNDRRTPVTTVASRRVFRLLWERFIQLRTDEMAQLYHLFRGDPTTSPAAGWIFGLRMHQVLGRKQSIWVSPIRGLLRDSKIVYDDYTASLTARGSTVELNVSKECDLIEGLELRMNHYYRPKPPSFPGIDSLLLARPRGNRQSLVLLIFRITRSTNDHKPNVESLHKINNLKFPSGTRKWYVVVTPSGTHPKIIFPAEEYFGSRTHQRLKPSEVFQVYHFSVLPEFLFRQK